MAAGIKRIDRTKELMMDLEKAASASVKEAAIMLKVIAREMVSARYMSPGRTGQQKDQNRRAARSEIQEELARYRHWNAEQIAAEKARGRTGFLNRNKR